MEGGGGSGTTENAGAGYPYQAKLPIRAYLHKFIVNSCVKFRLGLSMAFGEMLQNNKSDGSSLNPPEF